MRSWLIIRKFLSRYQQKLKLNLASREVGLEHANEAEFDRLGNNLKIRTILGIEFPEVSLPVAPGRNLAVLVEAATGNHLFQFNGYNAAQDFITRQKWAVSQDIELSD